MNWQLNRQEAHKAGKHTVPQVDCRTCWDEGRLRTFSHEEDDTEGLWHKGQHSDCQTCANFRAAHKPPEDPL
jgi:hypothetical protein